MTAIFSGIVAFFKAIPILNKRFSEFQVWYFNTQLEKMKAEDREAIIKAVKTYDQRPIEVVIGNPNAGEPSGNPGVVIVDAPPPGVPKPNGS